MSFIPTIVDHSKYKAQLSGLYLKYWKDQQVMQELVRLKPKGARIREWEIRGRRERGEVSHWSIQPVWLREVVVIVDADAAKSHWQHTWNLSSQYSTRGRASKIRKFHTHCTSECRCCARAKRFLRQPEMQYSRPPSETDGEMSSDEHILKL